MLRKHPQAPARAGDARVGIESRIGFAAIVVAQALLMALAIAVFLHAEGHKSFPASVTVAQQQTGRAVVPVSFTTRSRVGFTHTAMLARGGKAVPLRAGRVGYRRSRAARGR